jgi:hypothetical protein
MSLIISFLYLLLYLAIIILIAFGLRWILVAFMGWTLDANVEKWARVIVGLLCLIAIALWLSGVLGMGGGLPRFSLR